MTKVEKFNEKRGLFLQKLDTEMNLCAEHITILYAAERIIGNDRLKEELNKIRKRSFVLLERNRSVETQSYKKCTHRHCKELQRTWCDFIKGLCPRTK